MQDCEKCGRKIKTLYERVFGERPHYEPNGYYCVTCRIFYQVGAVKKDAGGLVTAVKPLHKTHANAAQNACVTEQERMQNALEPTKIEHERTLDHLCVRQVS